MKKRFLWGAATVLLLAAALTLAWRYTPLADVVTAENTVRWVETFDSYWWSPIVVALVYLPASVVMFPRPLITLAAVVAFGPWEGFTVAMSGVLVTAIVAYSAGRNVDEQRLRRWAGRRFERLSRMLRREGLVPITTMFMLPIAPFAIECMFCGALRARPWHVLVGAAVGNFPGILATTLVGDQIAAAISHDRELNRWILAGALAMMAAMAWGTRLWWKRMRSQVMAPA